MLGRPGISWKVVLAVSLTAGVLPCAANAGPWSWSAGAGWTSGYEPLPSGNDDDFTFGHQDGPPSTWLGTLALERDIKPTAQFKVEVGWLEYEGISRTQETSFISSGGPVFAYYSDDYRVSFVPIAAGIRWNGVLERSGIAPYLEFMPTVFVVSADERFNGTIRYGGYPIDSTASIDHHQSFARGVVGVTIGMGFHIRGGDSWDLNYGLQFRQSGPLDGEAEIAPGVTRDGLKALTTLGMVVGFSWLGGPR